MLELLILRIRQRLCDHDYRKHWSRASGSYVERCTKCGKEMIR